MDVSLNLYWHVQTLPKIGAPLHFRRFDSGVLVVQSDSHSDEQARHIHAQLCFKDFRCICVTMHTGNERRCKEIVSGVAQLGEETDFRYILKPCQRC